MEWDGAGIGQQQRGRIQPPRGGTGGAGRGGAGSGVSLSAWAGEEGLKY